MLRKMMLLTMAAQGMFCGCAVFGPARPEDCDGQDPRWVELSYGEEKARTINVKGYAAWVDETLGYGLENGYYKLVAVVPEGVIFPTVLTVGEFRVRVTKPGSYPFLLEKGVMNALNIEPLDYRIKFMATDDMAVPPFDPNERARSTRRMMNRKPGR